MPVAIASKSQLRDKSGAHRPTSRRADIRCEILKPEEYPQWDSLVDLSPHGTVFHYSWWLKTAADQFEILVLRDSCGSLAGGIPLPRSRRSGLDLIHSPLLTPYLGPIFDLSGASSTCDRLYRMRTWGEALARSINSFDSLRCVAGACAPDLQGFLWAGFQVNLAYTFRFPALSALESVTQGITRTHLQKLNKAEKCGVGVFTEDDVTTLIALNKMTFERQGMAPDYSPELVRKIWAAANSKQRGCIYIARTSDGAPAAALWTVRDNRTVYQIVSGVNWELRDVQAGYVVLWRAIQDALLSGYAFDFEGSALRGVEAYYRRWGPPAMPVWRIEKAGTWRGALLQSLIRQRDVRSSQITSNTPS